MRPEKIKRMISKERLEELEFDRILESMEIMGHETIIDVGAGPGAFSLPLARYLNTGQLFAVDIDSDLLKIIDERKKKERITNIKTVLADENINLEKNSADKIFISTVLHEVEDKESFLKSYRKILKENGRIYIVEFTSSKRSLRHDSDIEREFISSEETERVLQECGYKNIETENINELIYLVWAER